MEIIGLQCLTSSVSYLLSCDSRDQIQAHSRQASTLPLSYIPTTDRQGKLYPLYEQQGDMLRMPGPEQTGVLGLLEAH